MAVNQARKAQFSIFAIFNLGCWILVSISVFYGSVAGAIGAETQRAKRVLMLFSESKFVPGNVLVEQAAREVLQQGARPIEFYAEYLDAGRFPEENHYRLFREYMHEKYAQRPPDLVIAFLARKFELAGQLPAELFPNVPVVFGALTEEEIPRSRLGSNVTGVVQRFDVQGALSTILKVQPETQRIVVIGGTAPLDQLYLARTEEASRLLSQRVDVEFWHTRPVAEMRRDVAALPPRTVIFFTTVFRDAAGETFFPEQVASLLAMLSTVPLYVLGDPMIGNGVVGGRVAHLEAVGQRAGELARQVLEGAAPASLPIEVRNHGVPMFDWRALKRWGISEARLPPGSIVRFRQPSMWEQYRWHIIGAALIITLQSALIIGLLTHRARRRRAESEVERQRRELAHVTRVATINEMTASVAHELNQPLGAILSNAEAAEMFLNAEPPALDEVRDILADIRKDDQRAGEVIRRMRALLRKQDIVKEPLKINEVAEEILNLLKIDAAERKVVIKFEPTADLAEIRGDRIHLQQVLLNLGLNAIEAMAATPVKERQLVIRTEPGSNGSVKIAVADSGPGIVDQQLSQLFEPFFTTKKDGLGMGLIIARTIVEAHGGRIWAENNPAGGATFYVTLPVSHPTHGLYSGR
jgi:signal transduction histidine kinase